MYLFTPPTRIYVYVHIVDDNFKTYTFSVLQIVRNKTILSHTVRYMYSEI